MIYRKRKESTLVTAVLNYLQIFENRGDIVWFDRLNSGMIYSQSLSKKTGKVMPYVTRLCRAGTPDIYVVMRTGVVLWIECKEPSGDQRQAQKDFAERIIKADRHFYFIIRDTDDIRKILSHLLPDVMA